VVEREAAGRPVVLIGSSMGGYLAALYGARHPEVERLVLLAPAFGFARRWPESLGPQVVQQWRDTGWRDVFHYGEGRDRRLSYRIIEDGAGYEDFPVVPQPVLILHGTRDEVVPASASREFANRDSGNRRLVLLDSGHELTDVLERLWDETANFLGRRAPAGTGI
jgi:pimeloyl-ACP methyl ester carboxylesterase